MVLCSRGKMTIRKLFYRFRTGSVFAFLLASFLISTMLLLRSSEQSDHMIEYISQSQSGTPKLSEPALTENLSQLPEFPAPVIELLQLAEQHDLQLVVVDELVLRCIFVPTHHIASSCNQNHVIDKTSSKTSFQNFSFANFHSGQSTLPTQFLRSLQEKLSWACSARTASEPVITSCSHEKRLNVFILATVARENYFLLRSIFDASETGTLHAFLPTELQQIPDKFGKVQVLIPKDIAFFLWQWPRSKLVSCLEPKKRIGQNSDHIEGLAYLRDLLYRWGMDTQLVFGSLLGWYRDCGFIANDTDFDLRVDAENYDSRIENCLMHDKIINLRRVYGYLASSRGLQLFIGNMKVDLYVTYSTANGDYVIPNVIPPIREVLSVLPKASSGTCSADFLGHLFHVPCNPEPFIVEDYGSSWATPKHYGQYSNPNLVKTGFLSFPNMFALYLNYFPRLQRYTSSLFSNVATDCR